MKFSLNLSVLEVAKSVSSSFGGGGGGGGGGAGEGVPEEG